MAGFERSAVGYIRITGRAKDIIFRGGENIAVAEVEDLLYRQTVQDAAVVAMPDARLGERACVFGSLKAGRQFGFETMTGWLADAGMARP